MYFQLKKKKKKCVFYVLKNLEHSNGNLEWDSQIWQLGWGDLRQMNRVSFFYLSLKGVALVTLMKWTSDKKKRNHLGFANSGIINRPRILVISVMATSVSILGGHSKEYPKRKLDSLGKFLREVIEFISELLWKWSLLRGMTHLLETTI